MPEHAPASAAASSRKFSFSQNATLFYNCVMLLLIMLNVISLFLDRFLVGDLGQAFFAVMHLSDFGLYYLQQTHPLVVSIEAYFTGYLIAELLVRWGYAILHKSHARWFFFPFIHFYEVLAIIPELRFLRLLRAGLIAYELKKHHIRLWPLKLESSLVFYYHVFMEALTDQIILTALAQIERELSLNATYQSRIHALIEQHRDQFAKTLGTVLQQELAAALKQQHQDIVKGVGVVVHQAIADTPQIHQILKLMPLVGSRIEQLIQGMGQTLGENITAGLLEPFHQQSQSQQHYQYIAQRIAHIQLEQPHIHDLVGSVVETSLQVIREQVTGNTTWQNRNSTLNKE